MTDLTVVEGLGGFKQRLSRDAGLVNRELERLLPIVDGPEARLMEAVRYAALGGGKRIRPFLVLTAASLFNVDPDRALRVAAAVEMVHCYSLVHDDLPAMDDDDLRRGRPTTHKEFDEATAILAGQEYDTGMWDDQMLEESDH